MDVYLFGLCVCVVYSVGFVCVAYGEQHVCVYMCGLCVVRYVVWCVWFMVCM